MDHKLTLIRPRPGDWLTAAYWYHADNDEERKEGENKITDVIFEMAWDCKVRTKPIEWEYVDPMSPRVPDPPKGMMGNVKCVIGAAEVYGSLKTGPDFTDEIEPHQRELLRQATRRKFYEAGGFELTDEEADSIINEFAPTTAARRPH